MNSSWSILFPAQTTIHSLTFSFLAHNHACPRIYCYCCNSNIVSRQIAVVPPTQIHFLLPSFAPVSNAASRINIVVVHGAVRQWHSEFGAIFMPFILNAPQTNINWLCNRNNLLNNNFVKEQICGFGHIQLPRALCLPANISFRAIATQFFVIVALSVSLFVLYIPFCRWLLAECSLAPLSLGDVYV